MNATRLGFALLVGAVGALAPGTASADLPAIGAKGVIKPNQSIGGAKLGMSKNAVKEKWGRPKCQNFPGGPMVPSQSLCDWTDRNTADASKGEYARINFYGDGIGAQIIIIQAHTRSSDGRVVPGKISKWETPEGTHLGSQKSRIPQEFPAAVPNTSPGVNGYDLFGAGRFTRFTGGISASATRLVSVSLQADN